MVIYPDTWIKYPFDQFFKLISNNTLSRDKLSESGEVGNIHYGDVLIKYGEIITDKDSIPRIKEPIEINDNNFLQKNDVILADTAEDETVGKVSQVGDVSIPLVGGLHTVVCRPQKETADGYLGYYMNSRYYHDQLLPYITGIKVSSVSKKSLNETHIVIPCDIEEQKAIVDIFSDIDQHLTNLTELIEKKRNLRDGALADLLCCRTRLPGFKDEWKEKSFDDFIKINRGASPRPIEHYITTNRNGVNWIKIGDAPRFGKYITTTEERITQSGAAHSKRVNAGDFILSNSMSFGRPYLLAIDGCIHDGWLRLYDFQSDACADFLFYLLSSSYVKKQYETLAAGSGVQNLNKEVVKQVVVNLPSIPEQKAIADVLTSMDEEIEALEKEREKVLQIREGTIDDLLTGRVRLK